VTSPLEQLSAWFASQCDGEWEHGFGIEIGTLDNPGWWVEIDLHGTRLQGREFDAIEDRYDHDTEWLRCWTEGGAFHAACGPRRLEDALAVFLRWAESAEGEV
jgi:hypothetical protein